MSSSSNSNMSNVQNVGIGVVSFSSSNTPFSQTNATRPSTSTTTTNNNNQSVLNPNPQQQQRTHSFNVNNSIGTTTRLVNGVVPGVGTLVHANNHTAQLHHQSHGDYLTNHTSPVYSCVSPTSSSILNSQLYSTTSSNNSGNTNMSNQAVGNNNNVNNNSSSISATGQSNSSANGYCNISTLQSHHHHHHQHGSSSSTMQTQMHPQGLTVTLIATIPSSAASNSSQNTSQSSQILTATPLMPLIQPLIQNQAQITQSTSSTHQTPTQVTSNNNQTSSNLQTIAQSQPIIISSPSTNTPTTTTTSITSSTPSLVPQQPSTSAVSSSSSSPISSAQNLSSTTRDWFTYVYKIDSIEDLIKNHESQQNFVQSPVFSFTNHIIAANPSTTTSSPTNINNNTPSSSSQSFNNSPQSFSNNTGIGGSGGIGVPIYTTNQSNNSSSSSSTSSSSMTANLGNDPNNNCSNTTNKNLPTNKKPSNWRLIFYPNGAGTDCKNFLSIFLKYLSDEPVKIQMMFSIVDNMGEDVYVKYTVNKFCKSNDWGFKQLIHKNAILYQKEKFLKPYNGGTLSVRVKMRLDEQKHDYIKKLNDNLHYCKLLSENFSQYYYNNNMLNPVAESEQSSSSTGSEPTTTTTCLASSSTQPSASPSAASCSQGVATVASSSFSPVNVQNSNKGLITKGNHDNGTGAVGVGDAVGASVFNGISASSESESNSSYYDILLVVKSKSSVVANASGNSPTTANYSMCTNCVASQETISRASNRRSYSCLIDNNNDSEPSTKRLKTVSSASSTATSINQIQSIISSTTSNNTRCHCPAKPTDQLAQDTITKTELIEFRAHKCILAARSPVFKAMFNYKLKENLTNRVLIEDCHPDVVQAMLKYIYTAYLPDDIKDIAIDLYIAAEKYFIESLKIKCREYLIENLNTDSVVQIYILAELYNDSMLRKQSLKFISENIDRVTQDQDWNEFMSCYPQLFTNAFIRLCKKDF